MLLPQFLPLATRRPRRPQSSTLGRFLPLALLAGLVFWVGVEKGTVGRSHMSSATSRLEAPAWPGLSRFSVVVLPAYTTAIITAEMVTALVDARWGVGFHVAILWALLVHFSWARERSEAKLLLALCLAPLIRILSLGMPLGDVDLVYWFLIVGAPMIVAALLAARTLGLTRYDLGLTVRAIPVQLLIGAMGVGLGIVEYFILRPDPLIDELTWQQAWWPALILLVATGFGEELVFRGVMQSASTDALGKAAILYVAVVFAALHVGYKSAPDVAFVFLVALFFGWVVARTGSLLGVSLCHGIANAVLYVIVPFTALAVN
jgi:membrane protease YdiL (CAAX protease family)